jgi:hypothetical protein
LALPSSRSKNGSGLGASASAAVAGRSMAARTLSAPLSPLRTLTPPNAPPPKVAACSASLSATGAQGTTGVSLLGGCCSGPGSAEEGRLVDAAPLDDRSAALPPLAEAGPPPAAGLTLPAEFDRPDCHRVELRMLLADATVGRRPPLLPSSRPRSAGDGALASAFHNSRRETAASTDCVRESTAPLPLLAAAIAGLLSPPPLPRLLADEANAVVVELPLPPLPLGRRLLWPRLLNGFKEECECGSALARSSPPSRCFCSRGGEARSES